MKKGSSKKEQKVVETFASTSNTLMMVLHQAMFWFALYLSYKCNGEFVLQEFLIACCCPPCYIAYKLATDYDNCIGEGLFTLPE